MCFAGTMLCICVRLHHSVGANDRFPGMNHRRLSPLRGPQPAAFSDRRVALRGELRAPPGPKLRQPSSRLGSAWLRPFFARGRLPVDLQKLQDLSRKRRIIIRGE